MGCHLTSSYFFKDTSISFQEITIKFESKSSHNMIHPHALSVMYCIGLYHVQSADKITPLRL